MNIVFCADHRVLPGLHVAAYSVLDQVTPAAGRTHISVFSDVLGEVDMSVLNQTLAGTGKPFALELRRVDATALAGFPPLNGSLAPYYRLLAAQVMETDRFLYLDSDILCGLDVSELNRLDMGPAPAGLVPEAMLAGAVDRFTAEQLGNSPIEPYFNSGVILVNVAEWRRQRITEQAMAYITQNHPPFHDQSALNQVLHHKAFVLDSRFNCIANMRKNWPAMSRVCSGAGKLIHFLDYPKPWSLLGEFVHPQYSLWRATLEQTAMKHYRSWRRTPFAKVSKNSVAWNDYKKAIKDRVLFAGFSRGWLKRVKGVEQ